MVVTKASECVRSWLETHTQQELADVIGKRIGRNVAQSTISAIQRGEAIPRGDIMSALHAELQIDIAWWSEPIPAASTPSPIQTASDESGPLPRAELSSASTS